MKVGDLVRISKEFDSLGTWVDMEPRVATIVDIFNTITFGPSYVLEVDGQRLRVCYWKDDIDLVINPDDK